MRFRVVAPLAVLVMGLSHTHLQAAASGVKVLLQFEKPQSAVAVRAMQKEVAHALRRTVEVQFGSLSSVSEQANGRLVVFKMKGTCAMNQASDEAPIPGERLASAYVTDGVILPFGEILCDRVRASVAQTLGRGDAAQHEYQYGLALASVMRHELYHMLSGLREHTDSGVTKRSLSALDMVSNIDLPAPAAEAMTAPDTVLAR